MLKVDEHFSLERAYVVLRTLGLRHLIVVDIANRVRGIVTRKVSMSDWSMSTHEAVIKSSLEHRLRGDLTDPVALSLLALGLLCFSGQSVWRRWPAALAW